MTHDTAIFYAKKLKEFCEDSEGCRNCPFWNDNICMFRICVAPHCWDIPGEDGEEE